MAFDNVQVLPDPNFEKTVSRRHSQLSWRRILLVLGVLLLTGPVVPARAGDLDTDLAGVYVCEGTNPDGQPYTCVVEVVVRGGVFHLHWTLPEGEAFGFGLVTNGVLSVSFFTGAGEPPGHVAYAIEPGKPLVGRWIIAGTPGTYPETLTKLPTDLSAPTPQRGKPRGNPTNEIQG